MPALPRSCASWLAMVCGLVALDAGRAPSAWADAAPRLGPAAAEPAVEVSPTRCGSGECAANSACAEEDGPVTGGVDLVSRYIQRGISSDPDNQGTALQPYVNATLPLGFYAGYWGSNTSYAQGDPDWKTGLATARPPGARQTAIENDLTLGWGTTIGHVEVFAGVTALVFLNFHANDVLETNVGFDWKGRAFGWCMHTFASIETFLGQAAWGNRGDTYALVTHETEFLPGWWAIVDAAAHFYGRDGPLESVDRLGFRQLDLAMARRFRETGLNLRANWLVGGFDRMHVRQPDTLIWSAGWQF